MLTSNEGKRTTLRIFRLPSLNDHSAGIKVGFEFAIDVDIGLVLGILTISTPGDGGERLDCM